VVDSTCPFPAGFHPGSRQPPVAAVTDALKPLGVKVNEYPLSPERILQLMDEKRSKG